LRFSREVKHAMIPERGLFCCLLFATLISSAGGTSRYSESSECRTIVLLGAAEIRQLISLQQAMSVVQPTSMTESSSTSAGPVAAQLQRTFKRADRDMVHSWRE